MPVLEHGHQTDILISDGQNYYRIQVKTVEASGDDHIIENKRKDSDVDVIVYFARNSNWGYITPAFEENKRLLNHMSHRKFIKGRKEFHQL